MSEDQIRAEFGKLGRHFKAIEAVQALSEDPLGKFLKNEWIAACARSPALSERESAERLVELANAGRLPLKKVFDLAGGAALDLELNPEQRGRIDETLLAHLRDHLAAIAERPTPTRDRKAAAAAAAAAAERRESLRKELSRMITGRAIALPTFGADDGTIAYRILALDTPDALAFATLRILTSPIGELLCRCRDRECRRFFIVDPQIKEGRRDTRGRLRREYCCDDHRRREQKQTNVERQRALRAERKENRLAAARKHK